VDDLTSRLEVREVIEHWAVWRDAGDWDRFAAVAIAQTKMTISQRATVHGVEVDVVCTAAST
jgi:hypothetical protein